MANNPYSPPETQDSLLVEGGVVVTIGPKSVKLIKSRWWVVVAAFTGVSVSFMPLALLGLGIHNDWNSLTVGAAILCWMIGYLVPLFYFRIGGEVISQIRGKSNQPQLPD